jgi:rhodanese-related sulfurtransferase
VPVDIDRERVDALVAEGAQLVDVLPSDEYEVLHIAGASNLPLRELDERTAQELDRARPVILYCNDHF